MDQAKNFAKGTLVDGIEGGATSLTLNSGEGARFPDAPFNATIWDATDYPDPADDPDVEIVRVTAKATDTFTITRAQEGTSDAEHSSIGKTYLLIAGLTAKVINDMAPAVSRISYDGSDFRINDGDGVVLHLGGNGICGLGDVDGLVEGTKLLVNDATQQITLTKQVIMPNLPTSNPAIAGALWSDGGTLKISAG